MQQTKAPTAPRGLSRFFGGFSSRALLILVGGVFLLDLVIPDVLPWIDEIVLGILTLLIARWQARRQTRPDPDMPKPPPKNVTPAA